MCDCIYSIRLSNILFNDLYFFRLFLFDTKLSGLFTSDR